MLIRNRKNTPSGTYEGFSTNLLVGEQNGDSRDISIQTTDVEPGSMQFIHSHEEEQFYYIVSGSGTVIIDNEECPVSAEDTITIPSNSEHGIKNSGNEILRYLTVNRSFGIKRESEIWPNKPGEV